LEQIFSEEIVDQPGGLRRDHLVDPVSHFGVEVVKVDLLRVGAVKKVDPGFVKVQDVLFFLFIMN
jgi:hypothetical protein